MASIIEHNVTGATVNRSAAAHFTVDDGRKSREYLVLGGKGCVTVLTGRWIRDRRALGKTFWSVTELAAHYKQDGRTLAEYANRLTDWN